MMSHYGEDPDERLAVVSYNGGDDALEPIPLFAVETQTDGIDAASALAEHGGRARWTTVPLQRQGSYDDVRDLIEGADD